MASAVVSSRPTINDTVPYNKLVLLDLKPIGSGAFGDVFKAMHQDWTCQVAYKRLGVGCITDQR